MPDNYFQPRELECPCCGRNNFSPGLLGILNSMRRTFNRPLILNSACRCRNYDLKLNLKKLRKDFERRKMRNGLIYRIAVEEESLKIRASSHIKGLAADIRVSSPSEMDEVLREVYQYVAPVIQRVGINFEKGFVHIDLDTEKPQCICWGY